MEFFNNGGAPIRTLDEWRRLAPPVADHHWAPGRSAMELARDWLEDRAPDRVAALLRARADLAGLTLHTGVVEKRTRFDDIRGGPRHHDLLVHAAADSGRLVIGVEGKADEPFDLTLVDYIAAARRQRPATRAPERLDRLTAAFFGAVLAEDPSLGGLRYQLLSALAGTLADARRVDARHAVLLVHEFVTDRTDDALHAENAAALDAFVIRLGGPEVDRAVRGDGWIAGPVVVSGDGTWLPQVLPVFVAKLVTRRRV